MDDKKVTTQLRCISNCIVVETGRADEQFVSRWVPLTVGEIYTQVAGPHKPHHRFVLDDEQKVRAYPSYLFEELASSLAHQSQPGLE